MPDKYRKPGPNAVIHREHRHKWGPVIGCHSGMIIPTYQTGSRHGQQLALIRAAGGR